MAIGEILASRPLEFSEINIDVLEKSGVKLTEFDKNGDKKIDDNEIPELLIASKTSHYSELMKKESLEKFMTEIKDCQKGVENSSVRKYSCFAAAFGGVCGLGTFGLALTETVIIPELAFAGLVLASVAIPAAIMYFVGKNVFQHGKESQIKLLADELKNCQKTYDKTADPKAVPEKIKPLNDIASEQEIKKTDKETEAVDTASNESINVFNKKASKKELNKKPQKEITTEKVN